MINKIPPGFGLAQNTGAARVFLGYDKELIPSMHCAMLALQGVHKKPTNQTSKNQ